MWFANNEGFYFHTGTTKDVCRQLQENPRAEICFFSQAPPEKGGGRMLRARGTARFLENPALKERLIAERPWLKSIMPKWDPSLPAIFRLENGEAWCWTVADNMREARIPRFRF